MPAPRPMLALPLAVLPAACGSDDDSSTKPDDTGPEPETCEMVEYWLDGDGWGGSYVPIEAREQPSGYAAEPGDCDDADPEVNPGAEELCNGEDDNCDGLADDGWVELLVGAPGENTNGGMTGAVYVLYPGT